MTSRYITLLFFVVSVVSAATSCTRQEEVPYTPADNLITVSVAGFSGKLAVPRNKGFDNLRADISGYDWQVIATVEESVADGKTTITLPETIPAEDLCKVARDAYNDYEGFWPAAEVSDRNALVAGLGDIIAYKGDTPVGRIYLTDWDGVPANKNGACFVNFHYADRPFTLSGYNLTSPRESSKFIYEISMEEGWNIYIDRYGNPYRGMTLSTTDIPEEVSADLRWQFEVWP